MDETVFEPVFSAFWTPISSLRREEGQTRCSVVGGVIGNSVCFSGHRSFSQLRDRLYGDSLGRPVILEAVLQMQRSIFFV